MMMMKTREEAEKLWLLYDTLLPFLWKDKRKSKKNKKKITSSLKIDAEGSSKALVTPSTMCVLPRTHMHTHW
jgi:hypothetical protein